MPVHPLSESGHRPRVTVLLTVFQRTAFIREAIASALAQTQPADEILVTDDSSSGEIRQICEEYGVHYRANGEPLGVARNVAAAAAEARGELLAILNDDDAWEPDFLASLVPPLMSDPRRVLSFGDHWIMHADGRVDENATDRNTVRYGRDRLPGGEIAATAEVVLRDNGVPLAMGAVFRKDAVDWARLVPEVAGAYDFWLACELAATGRPFYYVPQRLTRYRLHDAMETARAAPDKAVPMVAIHHRLLAENRFPAWRTHLRRSLALALYALGRDRMRFAQRAAARECFRESLAVHPTPRALAGWFISWWPAHASEAGRGAEGRATGK